MKKTIGILGAGQLSQMLCEAARKISISTHIYAQSKLDPACELADETTIGSLEDTKALNSFFSKVNTVVFESEFFDMALLKKAAEGTAAEFYPNLNLMSRLRDKSEQKQISLDCNLPTSTFEKFDGSNLETWIKKQFSNWGPLVLKWSRLGYDGKGVFFLDTLDALKEAKAFCEKSLSKQISVYAEMLTPFVRELALVGCRSKTGEFISYPLCFTEQENGICMKVWGPATHPKAEAIAKSFAEATQMVGCFAIEFFEMEDGALLINELAPRVHNSGHYTQDAFGASQFENHLRAVLGMPLELKAKTPLFGMRNILGPDMSGKIKKLPKVPDGTYLHWYQKFDNSPFRKLGHVNFTAKTKEEISDKFEQVEKSLEQWVKDDPFA